MDAYASGPLPSQYAKMRPDMVRTAISLWTRILSDNPDGEPGRTARRRIPELEKLLAQ